MNDVAYKFTRGGAVSPFTGFAWPRGDWVYSAGDVTLCANGIHACRREAPPRWLDVELWRIQVEDAQEEHDGDVVARRVSATALSRYCAAHAAEFAGVGGYEAERRRQADWLLERLELNT